MVFCYLLKPSSVGEKEVDSVEELKEKQIYSRGNHRDLMAFLEKQTNKNKPKVDIIAGKQYFVNYTKHNTFSISGSASPTKKMNDVHNCIWKRVMA